MKQHPVNVVCIHCKEKTIIHYYGKVPIPQTYKPKEKLGWLINWTRPKKSTCPKCNIFMLPNGQAKFIDDNVIGVIKNAII